MFTADFRGVGRPGHNRALRVRFRSGQVTRHPASTRLGGKAISTSVPAFGALLM
jgi:hypothetical protein